ncbi:MSHA biogenesis protein MshP [Vibrio sp. CK2-1]|uniref:MSHA biogenesis protein MshP n=1 Tax=Vibrio sp. CK2-1 TaxID=2912249 RepID=UPI001F33BB8E|nr:MSHA biogenesis protein MshP [Vibrio sp. CK2-1]MCF7353832.1 MSHA biogenesis protein MshP [Vibrio sp. CK2-1]
MNNMKNAPSSLKHQSGSVLIVVIFVVVVMGLLAATMARLEWSNQDTQSREIMGNRAWFMAHSVNEWALTQLFPLGETGEDVGVLQGRCSSISFPESNGFFTDTEYQNCEIKSVECTPQVLNIAGGEDEPTSYGFFKVATKASCSDAQGLFNVERSQEVVVKALK